jgi:hypothetical protein
MIKSRRMILAGHVALVLGDQEWIEAFDGKVGNKQTTRKSKT